MEDVLIAKIKEDTKHFNANQKVFIVSTTGSNRSLVKGKFRGKGRYVKTWINKDNLEKFNKIN